MVLERPCSCQGQRRECGIIQQLKRCAWAFILGLRNVREIDTDAISLIDTTGLFVSPDLYLKGSLIWEPACKKPVIKVVTSIYRKECVTQKVEWALAAWVHIWAPLLTGLSPSQSFPSVTLWAILAPTGYSQARLTCSHLQEDSPPPSCPSGVAAPGCCFAWCSVSYP